MNFLTKVINENNKSDNSIEFAEWVNRLSESEIRRLLRFNPKYYFGGGKPGILPIESFHKIISELLNKEKDDRTKAIDHYNYGPSEGNIELRTVLAERMKKRELVNCESEDVVITTGSQQMLYALNDVLIKPGDIILTTRPVYLGFLMPAEKMGAKIITLPADENGLISESIEPAIRICEEKFRRKPKIVYTIPYSDNPKGITLPEKRKKEIADAVFPFKDILLIEDAAYKEIQFKESYEIKSIKRMDQENEHVAYLSTTTKEAASFRVGYSVLPPDIKDAVIKAKGYYDLNTSEWVQAILCKYYKYHIDKELPSIRKGYQERKEAMIKAIEEYMPAGEYTKPTGGFFVWYKYEKDIQSKDLIEKALENNISFVPGHSFYPKGNTCSITKEMKLQKQEIPMNDMRLSYSLLTPKLIHEGIERFSKLLDKLK